MITGANITGQARAKLDKDRPARKFDAKLAPEAPDYSLPGSWAALPNKLGGASFAPRNTKYPEAQKNALADVFFVHPTTAVSSLDDWNTPIDDPVAVKDLDFVLACTAGAFNAAARVYAPRYHQAAFYSFFDDKTDFGMKAIELAYRDTERAFGHYMDNHNNGRPFILAGHSQGSLHASRLLQEHIINKPVHGRMIAAYLIGGTIPMDVPGIRPSRCATDLGTVIAWNSYTKDGDPSIFTDGLIGRIGSSYTGMGGRRLVQTNPLSWLLNGPVVKASQNPGSLAATGEDPADITIVPAVCGADASGIALMIERPQVNGFTLPATVDPPVLNPRSGDYHDFDYQLFYESMRKNAIDRVKAFVDRR